MATKVTAKVEYHGHDGAKSVDLEPGQSLEVSDEKAAQLRRDFPDWFDFPAAKPAAKPARKAKAVAPADEE